MQYVYVVIGGGIGAGLRYVSTQLIQALFNPSFPLGTLFVNTLGALVIGFVSAAFETITVSVGVRLFLITGFLGGYTTFSAYSLETVRCFLQGNIKQACLNIALNNGICIMCVLLGMWAGKTILVK